MGHDKDGYAVAKWTYHTYWEVTYPHVDGRVETRKPEEFHDVFGYTYWAKCGKGQTGDQYLSRWVKDEVRPKAKQQVENDIVARNRDSLQKRDEWFARDGGLLAKQLQAPPPLRTYQPFDGKRLKVPYPFTTEEMPGDEHGIIKVSWC